MQFWSLKNRHNLSEKNLFEESWQFNRVAYWFKLTFKLSFFTRQKKNMRAGVPWRLPHRNMLFLSISLRFGCFKPVLRSVKTRQNWSFVPLETLQKWSRIQWTFLHGLSPDKHLSQFWTFMAVLDRFQARVLCKFSQMQTQVCVVFLQVCRVFRWR